MKFTEVISQHASAQAALSIDLEDWHPLSQRRLTGRIGPPSGRVRLQMQQLLRILNRHATRATFFVLGSLAEQDPGLVGALHDDGHEIATHGHGHVPLHRLDAEEVETDIGRSIDVLRDITGYKVKGHRAPEFSILRDNLDVLRILRRLGIEYDSSIFPVHHRRYGIPDFPTRPTRIEWEDGQGIWEFPLLTLPFIRARVPAAGGGYFRLLPAWVHKNAMTSAVSAGRLPVLYFHPYEFDPHALRLPTNGKDLRHHAWIALQNLGRRRLARRLDRLMERYSFGPLGDFVPPQGTLKPHPGQSTNRGVG